MGRWVDGPKEDLFEKVRETLGGLPFFAEDLGYITPDVHALRDRFQIPGMAVLQFGFGDPGAHIHLPHTFTPNKVVYTGTHDNDTLLGWWKSAVTDQERVHALAYLGHCDDGINWAMIRAAHEFRRQPVRDSFAGRAQPGQRSAHEYPQRARRQLALAFRATCCVPSWPKSSP